MPVAILVFSILIIITVFYVPPDHWMIVGFLIFLITGNSFLISKLILKNNKYSLLVSSIVLSFLVFLSLKILEPVIILLALSFFSLIFILIK